MAFCESSEKILAQDDTTRGSQVGKRSLCVHVQWVGNMTNISLSSKSEIWNFEILWPEAFKGTRQWWNNIKTRGSNPVFVHMADRWTVTINKHWTAERQRPKSWQTLCTWTDSMLHISILSPHSSVQNIHYRNCLCLIHLLLILFWGVLGGYTGPMMWMDAVCQKVTSIHPSFHFP